MTTIKPLISCPLCGNKFKIGAELAKNYYINISEDIDINQFKNHFWNYYHKSIDSFISHQDLNILFDYFSPHFKTINTSIDVENETTTTLKILYNIKDGDEFYFMSYGKELLNNLIKTK